MTQRDAEFAEYFAGRFGSVRNSAYLLCGDWHRAEDLAQTAFAKLYLGWERVQRRESLDAYTRQVLFRLFLGQRRTGWFRRERTGEYLPEQAAGSPAVESRLDLMAALALLPARQRAVVVLRYWDDLSIEETGGILGCSTGTVESQASKGLRTLRTVLAERRPIDLERAW